MADSERYRMTVRLSQADLDQLRVLMRDLNIGNQSDVVRHALAELAKQRGVRPAETT